MGGDAPDISVTPRTFQVAMFWLNAAADWNIWPINTTFATFQAAMFWLNAAA